MNYEMVSVRTRSVDYFLTCLSRSFVFLQVSVKCGVHLGVMSPDLMGLIAHQYIK